MKRALILTAAMAAALALGACDEPTYNKPIESMSCTELAREIGHFTQVEKDATLDSFLGTIDSLTGDSSSERLEGGLESLAGDLTAQDARTQLSKLNAAYAQRRCY
ncbi:hypothetical protein [Ascidiaceihabitans sp.]|uniref:hypothetical protein n=1 Tax=Ascidiaceihabitans sp. TaxID=1872644 RepID=UPI0032995344